MSEKMTVERFRLGWFATGSYMNKCSQCGDEFIGDKRASVCLDCTIKNTNKAFEEFCKLNCETRRLRAVIDDLPEVLGYRQMPGTLGVTEKITKSSLLAKHGVEE